MKPELTVEQQAAAHGDKLWEREPDNCCKMRKVLRCARALKPFEAWITAIRRDQTLDRANASIVEWDRKFGLVKVNPLVSWTHARRLGLRPRERRPYNPLHDQGIPSIGCWPCTSPVAGRGSALRALAGQSKKECGLHLPTRNHPTRL